jgi:hypothetical protein
VTDAGTGTAPEVTDPPVTAGPDGTHGAGDADRPRGLDDGRIEALAGAIVVCLVGLAGLWFRSHPGPVFLDHWGFSLVHPANGNHFWQRITELRSVSVLVAGSILAAVVVVSRDRLRALACLVAPTVAVVLAEYVLKPGIGRRFTEVLSFPSGTTTVMGALAMAWILAVPRRIRPVVAAMGAFLVGLECMAVVALQWHYPADAVGGAAFGAGFVVLVDGVLHLVVGAVRHRQAHDEVRGTAPTS